jgi:alpha-glucosidase (family GH31 glycosyl hydrolase)
MSIPPIPAFQPIANPAAIVTAKNARFTVLTDRLIRLEYSPTNTFEDHASQAFWYRDLPVCAFTQKVSMTSVEIETEALLLKYWITRLGFRPMTLSITLKQTGVTWRYGTPQSGNLGGTRRTLDMTFGPIRLENGLLSRSGWAVVDDSHSLVFNQDGWLEARSNPQRDEYFFGYGQDYSACLLDFSRVAGKIPMIPRYILGNWWSRYWAYTQDELKSLMEDFRAHEVPLSICIIDMDWHVTKTGNESDGWTGYTWNRELFPDYRDFIRWLHSQRLRTALNLHPAKGVYPHEEQYEQMTNRMGVDPASKQPVPFDISDPRFTEAYFDLLLHPYEASTPAAEGGNDGVDFWWMDWQQGHKSKISGLDPLWLLNHLHYYDLGRDGHKRPFFFSRWGGLGNHRYPIGFSGDTFVTWSALAFQPRFTATAANVAYGWWSHDIGGHMLADHGPELYLRWVQFGVFSPIFRLHSTNKPALDRRPWSKPERYYKAARAAMQLRHALIPYIYSMAWRAHQTGISLVTPMYYGNMQEAEAFEASDQYYFGSELLVAPILTPVHSETGLADKKVWFPSGIWTNFFTGEQFVGGDWREIKAALEDIPVFARSGAIIPLAPKPVWGGLDNPSDVDIFIFPGSDNSFALYEDDGETTDYLQRKYAITTFTLQDGRFTIQPVSGEASLLPAKRTYHIHLRGVDKSTQASLPGSHDLATRTLSLDPIVLAGDETITVTFK